MKKVTSFFADAWRILYVSFHFGKSSAVYYLLCGLIRNARYPFVALVTARLVEHVQISSESGLISPYIWVFLLFYFILFALNRVWWPLNAYFRNLLLSKVQFGIKRALCEGANSAKFSSFEDSKWLNKLELANEEASGERPIQVIDHIISMLCVAITMAMMFIPLLTYRPLMSVLVIIFSYFAFWTNGYFAAKVFKYQKDNAHQKRKLTYVSQLFLDRSAVKEIYALNLFDFMRNRVSSASKNYNKGLQRTNLMQVFGGLAGWFCNTAVCAVFYVIMIQDAQMGIITIGMLTFYLSAIESTSSTVEHVSHSFGKLSQGRQYINNFFQFLNNDTVGNNKKETCSKAMSFDSSNREYQLKFHNVSFKYPNADRFALENISFELENESVAIVGMNGAGKSTLVKLLLRLYDPTSGVITLNGVDIQTFDEIEWRRMFSVCFQDFYNYAFPIKTAIGLGDLQRIHNADDICASAKAINLDEIITALPNQYDTCIGRGYSTDGIELSGGQKQRLAIARVMFSSSPIVVMDEPTSALDPIAEAKALELFNSRVQGGLGIIITHRLAYAAQCDKVLVLNDGKLIEFGTHSSLINSKTGIYKDMYNAQSERYRKEGGQYD